MLCTPQWCLVCLLSGFIFCGLLGSVPLFFFNQQPDKVSNVLTGSHWSARRRWSSRKSWTHCKYNPNLQCFLIMKNANNIRNMIFHESLCLLLTNFLCDCRRVLLVRMAALDHLDQWELVDSLAWWDSLGRKEPMWVFVIIELLNPCFVARFVKQFVGNSLWFCFPHQGEPGKSGEKGLVGRPGLRVSKLCVTMFVIFWPHEFTTESRTKNTSLWTGSAW